MMLPPRSALGLLPPPSCLVSVPLLPASQPGLAFTSPSQPTTVSWAVSNPFGGVLGPLAQHQPTSSTTSFGSQPGLVSWAVGNPIGGTLGPLAQQQPTGSMPSVGSQPGLVLSPAAAPFPKKLVDRFQAGNFVEMKELLTDNMALISQLETVQGWSPAHMLGPARPRLREVASLATWCYCFMGYVAIRSSDPMTRSQLVYARLLIKEAQRHGGLGWLDYDRAFRQQAAADPSLAWNTLSPGLQASTMFHQHPAGQRSFCSLCREVDHTRAHCALACLQPPATSSPVVVCTSQPPPTRRRPETALRICISWNMGVCVFQGRCTYRHVCATCQLPPHHRAKDCPRTPDSSSYRRRPGASRMGPSAPGPVVPWQHRDQ